MTQISVRLEGADKLRQGLNGWMRSIPNLTKRMLKQAMEKAKKAAQHYPPEVPGQTYVRTGIYGRSFGIEESGLTYTLRSDAISREGRAYTRYVGGMADGSEQAYMHVGRWKLIREAVDEAIEPLTVELNAELAQAARQEGIGL